MQLVDVTEQRYDRELLDAIVSATPDLLLVSCVKSSSVKCE
ncbi:hypothetical protein ACQP00_21475 [Dactylosporangium sp. CS-047395]